MQGRRIEDYWQDFFFSFKLRCYLLGVTGDILLKEKTAGILKFSTAGQGGVLAVASAGGTLGRRKGMSVCHCVLQFHPLAKFPLHSDSWEWSILGCVTWLKFFTTVPLSWKQRQD